MLFNYSFVCLFSCFMWPSDAHFLKGLRLWALIQVNRKKLTED